MITQGTTSLKKKSKKAVAKPKAKVKAKKVVKASAKKPATKKSAKLPAKKNAKKAVKAKKSAKPIARKAVKKAAAKKVAPKKAAKKPVKKTAAKKVTAKKVVAKKVVTPKFAVAAPVAVSWPPMVEAVLKQLDDSKAEAIVTIDVSRKSTIADTMVVASGRSSRHVNAIADQVVDALSKLGKKNIRVEGVPQCDWVLVDAGDVMIHIFRPEVRSFYNLEKLWSEHAPQ